METTLGQGEAAGKQFCGFRESVGKQFWDLGKTEGKQFQDCEQSAGRQYWQQQVVQQSSKLRVTLLIRSVSHKSNSQLASSW
jgi:hypothetical protein